MKQLLLIAAVCVLCAGSSAQEQKNLEYLGGYGGSSVIFTGEGHTYFTGEGAVRIGAFQLGGFGYGGEATSERDLIGNQFDIEFGLGGFLLGYESPRMGMLSLNAELRFGFGSFEANRDLGENIYEIYRDRFTQYTPRLALAFTPINMVQVRLYGGYAFHSDVDLGTLDFDPNRPEFGLSLYWGWFE